jgi:hypothetical protein
MSARELIDDSLLLSTGSTPTRSCVPASAVVIAELIGVVADGAVALVRRDADPDGAVLRARVAVDLHSQHVGHQVVMVFEQSDWQGAIVIGVLRPHQDRFSEPSPGRIELEADGARLVVAAREQLVLRCGKASVTLTKAGKVLIEGTYVSSRSSGAHPIKGGSVDIN